MLLLKGLGKKDTVLTTRHKNTLSACTFIFLEHFNFPSGSSKTVMWRRFGWRSWCESQSRAGSCFLPGESESVSCFLAGTGCGGVNRGNPTCWRGISTVPSYTHTTGTLAIFYYLFLSQTHINTYTHPRVDALLHTQAHVCMHSPSCSSFETKNFCAASVTTEIRI